MCINIVTQSENKKLKKVHGTGDHQIQAAQRGGDRLANIDL